MAKLVPWDSINLFGYNVKDGDNDDFLVSIEATCVTGFECAGQTEVEEKFGVEATKHQGRIFFDVPLSKVDQVLSLRCIDNAFVIFGVWPHVGFDLKQTPHEECLKSLNDLLLPGLNWRKAFKTWNKIFGFFQNESDLQDVIAQAESNLQRELKSERPIPRFRCTCYRTGKDSHAFQSMDVAKSFGGALEEHFGWVPKMKDHDLEVVVNIDLDQIYCCIALTRQSLFRRNVVSFGPTTLRATICASMLKLANIQPGEVVVDPMCGGGSIPLEGALTYPHSLFLAGDYHIKAVERSFENFHHNAGNESKRLRLELCRWDVTKIPLRENTVDVFITDLPFGKRSGSKADNRVLYPKVMLSMARVVKPSTGRAVLLTQDKTSMFKCTNKFSRYWKTTKQLSCNIGGLTALVFLMKRTDVQVSEPEKPSMTS